MSRTAIAGLALVAVAGCAAYGGSGYETGPAGTNLVGTYWRLVDLDGTEPAAGRDGKEPHLVLQSDYRVTGSDGCNHLVGTWQESDGGVTFGPLLTTKMACPDMDVQTRFHAALDGAVGVEIRGGRLLMTAADGSRLEFAAGAAK